jgi:hypothetical protein
VGIEVLSNPFTKIPFRIEKVSGSIEGTSEKSNRFLPTSEMLAE